jgi:DeoR/GlpR family transcriptional regulator of sugar metabolism
MIDVSQYTIALSTYDKVGAAEPYYICAANVIDTFITENDPSMANLADFKESGIMIK